jgi:hypothetical protein
MHYVVHGSRGWFFDRVSYKSALRHKKYVHELWKIYIDACLAILNVYILEIIWWCDCAGTLVKTFKTHFLPFFDKLSMYLTPMLVSEMINCRIWSLCAASIRAVSMKQYIILDFYSPDHVLVIWKWIFKWLVSLNNATIFLLIFHIYRARIKQQKKEGFDDLDEHCRETTVG